MSDEPVVIKVFDNEIDAAMAQQRLADAGLKAFVFKDDGGGMEPHLQRTIGVRLVTIRSESERAQEILES